MVGRRVLGQVFRKVDELEEFGQLFDWAATEECSTELLPRGLRTMIAVGEGGKGFSKDDGGDQPEHALACSEKGGECGILATKEQVLHNWQNAFRR